MLSQKRTERYGPASNDPKDVEMWLYAKHGVRELPTPHGVAPQVADKSAKESNS